MVAFFLFASKITTANTRASESLLDFETCCRILRNNLNTNFPKTNIECKNISLLNLCCLIVCATIYYNLLQLFVLHFTNSSKIIKNLQIIPKHLIIRKIKIFKFKFNKYNLRLLIKRKIKEK